MRRRCLALVPFLIPACSAAQNLGGDHGFDGGAPDGSIATSADLQAGDDGGVVSPADGAPSGSSEQRRVALGREFSCAITAAGGARCWGNNYYGQLGNRRSREDGSRTPVDVNGLPSGVAGITARYDHACAWTKAGAASCWGAGSNGKLGTSASESSIPVGVVGLGTGVLSVAAGRDHSCALVAGGKVKCWGSNGSGQIGNGAAGYENNPPTDVAPLGPASAIATGADHGCAIVGGKVSCWGSNSNDQLGTPQTTNAPTPVEVPGLTGAVDISSTAYATCVLNAGGDVKCWGAQMGSATLAAWTPMQLVALAPGGEFHLCGITSAGALRCWGHNYNGQFGDGTPTGTGPSGPSGLAVVAAAGGEDHTCAITTAGVAKCWRGNNFMQLGNATTSPDSYSPHDVTGW